MSGSQPSILLLEERGTFEGAAQELVLPTESGELFERRVQESITWIDGRMTVSF